PYPRSRPRGGRNARCQGWRHLCRRDLRCRRLQPRDPQRRGNPGHRHRPRPLGDSLDMRMGHDGPTAADVLAKASEADLANIIYIFGEERYSRAVARAIVAARKEAPITTTQALADIVGKVVHSKPNEIHPATRTFQGLRIFV